MAEAVSGTAWGIPSHDTFGRVFALLNAEQFQRCFGAWMQGMCQRLGGQVITIDSKTLRGSSDSNSNKAAIQMVSAWAQANRVVLGQVSRLSLGHALKTSITSPGRYGYYLTVTDTGQVRLDSRTIRQAQRLHGKWGAAH